MHHFRLALIMACLASLLLTSCADRHVAQNNEHRRSRLWLVADPSTLLTELEPVQSIVTPPAPKLSAIETWHNPPTHWLEIERDMVAREWISPPRAARCYALLAVGINDALLLAEGVRAKGIDISDDATVASTAERILGYSHPLLAELFQQQAAEARWVGVWRKEATPEGVANGQQLGHLVGDYVITWARSDGAEDFTDFSDPAPRPGVWQRTPPHLWSALDPGWGELQPIGISSVKNLEAAEPPAWDSPTFKAERDAFQHTQQSLTDADRALAKTWAAGMGTMTPAGLWLKIAGDLIERDQLDSHGAAAIYATLTVAMHDGFIACWHSKFSYLVARPVTWMQGHDSDWMPYIETPPFPSYPSGHSTVSGAASTVLSAYFHQDRRQLFGWANDASQSRVVGGIHWLLDGKAGLAQGQSVGVSVLTQAGQ